MVKDASDIPPETLTDLSEVNERLRHELVEHKRLEAELKIRVRQQAAVAELGQRALVGMNPTILMDEVVHLVAETLRVTHVAILELRPDELRPDKLQPDELRPDKAGLLFRAGTGWPKDVISQITFDAKTASQAGYTLMSAGPVVVEVYASETRFDILPVVQERGLTSGLSVVIQGQDRPYGVLEVHNTEPHSFTEDDIDFLQAAANILAMAIERKQTETEIVRRNHALLALQSAGAAIASSLDLQYVLNTVSRKLADLLEVDACTICEWKQGNDIVVTMARYTVDGELDKAAIPTICRLADFPLTETVLIERTPRQMWLSQAGNVPPELARLKENGIASLLMLPLIFQDRVIGLACLEDSRSARMFTEQEISLAQWLANQAASAIENARLYDETRKILKEQIALREVGALLSSILDLDGVLNQIAEQMGQVIDVTGGVYICSLDSDTVEATVVAEYFSPLTGSPESKLRTSYHLPRDFPGIIEYLQAGQSRLLQLNDPDLTKTEKAYMQRFGAQTMLIIPLQVGGHIIAYAELWESRHRREFTNQEISMCQGLAQQAAIALENARLFEQTQAALEETSMLYQVARTLTRLDNEQEMFELVLTEYLQYLNLDQGSVMIFDEDKVHSNLKAQMVEGGLAEPGMRLPIADYPALLSLINSKQPVVINDAQRSKMLESTRPLALELGVKSLLLVPLVVRGDVIGALSAIATIEIHEFTDREVSLVKAVANQLAIAIENAHLTAETNRRALQLTVLHELDRAITKNVNPHDIYYVFARHAIRLLPYDAMSITLVDDGELRVAFVIGGQGEVENIMPVGTTLSLRHSVVGRVVIQGQPLLRHNITGSPNFAEDTWFTALGIQSMMMMPLRVKGEIIGTWNIGNQKVGAYGPDDLEIAQAMAEQLAMTLENTRLYTEIHQYLEELTTLNMISQIITSTLDLQEMLTIITSHTMELLQVEATSVALYDEIRQELWFAAASGSASDFVREKRLPVGEGIIGWVVQQGEPVMVPDVSKTSRFSDQFDQISNFTTRSILCVPLHTKGQIIGAIEALNKAGKFDDDDLRLLSSLASLAAGGIENARLFKQAQQEIIERKRAEEALQVTVQRLETAHNQAMVYAQELNAEITERKRAEEALEKERALLAHRVAERTADLRAANEELAQAARLKDEFLASMSHELRTPLSAVLGLSEVIRGEIYGPVNDKQRKALSDIEESGRHLLSLINDILDLSKIEAGKLELQLDRVPVASVCQASLRMIEDEARRKDIEVSSKLDTSVTILQADERRLKQILVNLLSNAVKFTPDGGAVGLEVTGAAERDEVDLTVWDTGIGISPEDLKHLFQPFMQLNAGLARQYPGTGLGLALVHRMVELHDGRITVESEQGQGSRFTISLPWQAQAQSPAPADPETQGSVVEIAVPRTEAVPATVPERSVADSTVPGESSDHHHVEPSPPVLEPPLILLAEDDQKLANFMKNYLTAKHYRVILAGNGLDAVELARQEQPDLILMDVQMPEIDGLEATRRIRAEDEPDLAGVPIIALTALAMSGDRERCLEAGANHYLSKPIKLKELAQAIEIQLIKNQLSKKG